MRTQKREQVLTDVAQLVGYRPSKRKVDSCIPGQGHAGVVCSVLIGAHMRDS